MKSIDSSIIGNVENDLNGKNAENVPNGKNLLETIDFLHECLRSNSTVSANFEEKLRDKNASYTY